MAVQEAEQSDNHEDTGQNDKPAGNGETSVNTYLVLKESSAKDAKTIVCQGAFCGKTSDGHLLFQAHVTTFRFAVKYQAKACIETKQWKVIESKGIEVESPGTVPSRPEAPTVSGKGKNHLKLKWNAPEARGSPVNLYEAELRALEGDGADDGVHEPWGSAMLVHKSPDSKCEVKSLKPGTAYQTRVRAWNGYGASLPSPWVCVVTSATVPAQPPAPYVAQVGLEWMLIAWQPPEDDGGATISRYSLEVDDTLEETPQFTVQYNGPEKQFLMKPVVCGRKYRFRVRAFNAVGCSQFSNVMEASGVCGAPSAPGPIQLAGNLTAHGMTLTWTPPVKDNGSAVQLYQVAMRRIIEGMPMGYFEIVYNGPDLACEVGRLFPASVYEFCVVAISALGTSAPSPPTCITTAGAPPGPPPPPFLLQNEVGKLTVGWTLPDICNGAPVTSFRVERIVSDGDGNSCGRVLVHEGSAISYSFQGLPPGSAMILSVSAINMYGIGPSSMPATFVTPCTPPGRPVISQASACGAGRATIHWSPPEQDGGSPITLYKVYVHLKGSSQEPLQVLTERSPLAVDSLSPGSIYVVKVLAINSLGNGDWSEPLKFSSDPGAPAAPDSPEIVKVTSQSVTLSWQLPQRTNGADVEEFSLQMLEIATPSQGNAGFQTMYTGSLRCFEVMGLRPGTSYKFRVCARNAAGQGPFSLPATSTTAAVPPGPPLAVTLTGVTASSIKLKWSPPAFEGGSPVTSYAVLVTEVADDKADDQGGRGRKSLSSGAKEAWRGSATSCKLKAAPDSHYEILLIAHNVIGPGIPAPPVFAKTPQQQTAPVKLKPPPRLAAPTVSVKGSQVRVSWLPCKDSNPPVRCFKLVAEEVSGLIRDMQTLEEKDACKELYVGSGTSTEVTSLLPGCSYNLSVMAENDVGRGEWSPPTLVQLKSPQEKKKSRELAPPVPEDLKLEKATRTSLKLSWTAGSGEGRERETFQLEIAEGSGSFECVYTGTDTGFTVMKLKSNCRYRARVLAMTRSGSASRYTEEQSFKTLAPADSKWKTHLLSLIALLHLVILFYVLLRSNE
uniref:Fibronectin type-III domain-containing protein n=1 Tax=Hanusia phi TaxID=3032 RepID=A0A7S0EGI8_9CRYP